MAIIVEINFKQFQKGDLFYNKMYFGSISFIQEQNENDIMTLVTLYRSINLKK